MAEAMLFHHVQGQTAGFHAFADDLRRAGHTVHAPDLFDGRTFDNIGAGPVDAAEVGVGKRIKRGVRAARALPGDVVASAPDVELLLYPGDRHDFAHSSLPSDRPKDAALLMQRLLDFLATR